MNNSPTYNQHYKECLSLKDPMRVGYYTEILKSLSVKPTFPSDNHKYNILIHTLAGKVDDCFKRKQNIAEDNFCLNIKDALKFSEVTDIFNLFYDEIKENTYGCDFSANTVQIVRSHHTPEKFEASWIWHYDDNPEPSIKLFIYLTDVDSEHAPFTYISNPETKECAKIESSRISPFKRVQQQFEGSRIRDSHIDILAEMGMIPQELTGKAGTAFIFDPNIIHRATVPKPNNFRDALIFHLYPTKNKTPLETVFGRDVKQYPLL